MVTKLMTNIDSYFYTFLDTESKKNNITKRELIERVIAEYITNKENKKLQDSYNLMGKDKDYLEEMKENTKYLGNM